MVKIEFKATNGSIYVINFDEKKIIEENSLNNNNFDQTIFDRIKSTPKHKDESKLYNYGNGGWFASGTNFGQVTAGARVLFDSDKNKTQNGEHFTIQGWINISGSKPYQIPVGNAHRIHSDKLEVIFYNADGTISGTRYLEKPTPPSQTLLF